ncbi:MAG: M10 family metallopeptidase C-terminal domain-containing protein, partial [Phormidesmis sp.]
ESTNPSNGVGVLFEDGSRFTGTLTNSGTINGGRDGVNFGNGGTARGSLVNEEGGVITSASRAVNIGGDRNTIRNQGLITTSADPRNGTIYADQSANNFRIINDDSGIIDVGRGLNGDAISLQLGANVRGSILNRGTVRGRGVADGEPNNATNQATAIRLYHGDQAGPLSVFNGSIRNLGAGILSSDQGSTVLIENQVELNGDIINNGSILARGDGGTGIEVQGSLTGTITNRGLIRATESAIDGSNASEALDVRNSGVIVGDVLLSDFDDVFNGANGIVRGEIQGLAGDDILSGGRLRDRLNGGVGHDTLTGGAGRDTFIIEQFNGNDVITDFQNGVDRVDISALNFSDAQLSSVLGAAEQQGNDVLVTFSSVSQSPTLQDSVLLQNFQLNQLGASDFVR